MTKEKRLITRRNVSSLGSYDQEKIKNLSRNSTKENTAYVGKGRIRITFTDTLNPMTNLESVYYLYARDWSRYAKPSVRRDVEIAYRKAKQDAKK